MLTYMWQPKFLKIEKQFIYSYFPFFLSLTFNKFIFLRKLLNQLWNKLKCFHISHQCRRHRKLTSKLQTKYVNCNNNFWARKAYKTSYHKSNAKLNLDDQIQLTFCQPVVLDGSNKWFITQSKTQSKTQRKQISVQQTSKWEQI